MSEQYPTFGNPGVTYERWQDPQHGAAFYLFTLEPRAFKYVLRRGIDIERLLKAADPWSTSEKIIIHAALSLYSRYCVRESGRQDASTGDIAERMYDRQFEAIVNAMRIALLCDIYSCRDATCILAAATSYFCRTRCLEGW